MGFPHFPTGFFFSSPVFAPRTSLKIGEDVEVLLALAREPNVELYYPDPMECREMNESLEGHIPNPNKVNLSQSSLRHFKI